MKKTIRVCGFLVFLLIFLFSQIEKPVALKASNPVLHGGKVDIYFNDNLIVDWGDALPFIDKNSGRTMIPLRFYSEKIGYNVEWEQKTKKITISYQWVEHYGISDYNVTTVISLWVGNRKTIIEKLYNNVPQYNTTQTVWLDVAPYQETTYPWRVFVPLRFISQVLGDVVTYVAPGEKIPFLPLVTVTQPSVFLAHFVPEGPSDYQIVPGVRVGKYTLDWPIEQFIKSEGRIKNCVIFEESSVYSIVFSSGFIIKVKWDQKIELLNLWPPDYDYDYNYWLLAPSGKKYMQINGDKRLFSISDFEADFSQWNYKLVISHTSNGREIRNYMFDNGIEIQLWEGYWVNGIMFFKPGWNSLRIVGQDLP